MANAIGGAEPGAIGRMRMAVFTVLLLLVLGCTPNPTGESNSPAGGGADAEVVDQGSDGLFEAPEPGPYQVSPEFVGSVLADGAVTFEELVLTHQHFYRCLVEGGLVGEVSIGDPKRGIGGLHVSHPLDNDPDNPTDRSYPVILGCELSIEPITAVFARDNPETPEQLEQQRQAILDCVRREIPDVYEDLSEDWDLDTLMVWLSSLPPEEYGEGVRGAAGECAVGGEVTWVSLREAAGLEG